MLLFLTLGCGGPQVDEPKEDRVSEENDGDDQSTIEEITQNEPSQGDSRVEPAAEPTSEPTAEPATSANAGPVESTLSKDTSRGACSSVPLGSGVGLWGVLLVLGRRRAKQYNIG